MRRKHHKPEEIVAKLRQVDVLTSQGKLVADAVRAIGVTEVTYYRWRQEYGGDCHVNLAPAERESKDSALVQAAVAARQF
jgi:putative transposase